MKTIGLIGGMSWESSAEYYRIINEEVKKRRGGLHSARCILYSVDFEEIEMCQSRGEWHKAAEILANAARSLEAAGAECIVLCTNTMHKVADEIQAGMRIPLLHIADITAKQALTHNIKTIGLLGTRYTMEQDFYTSRLETQGLKVLTPEEGDRGIVNEVIYHELCLGEISNESRNQFKRMIQSLVEQGAEGIVLGCTEIGLLIKQEDSFVPLFDTTLIHAIGAVDYALSEVIK
ncbi:aspartate racemase [Desulfitobacterium dehalogenans ATCC 51507]|uniref:Aspartate racemase n=1 Tax=Desulfitobacterium dehalogenans (strain ATCC 51507 / DSM 9161 / JW/IU-DC1) TaxID=756499 RepID=I4A6N0_DESDJ|nr:aspartate/glutamate racemase family protein [Desulfitobacterium dehalogenans]AFL99614.1 aspartate racemase [Desulfitobacterium dehalogenans ATCC 51507]